MRTIVSAVAAAAVLAWTGCGDEPKPPPGPSDVDAITAATGRIVYQCRSVERGFINAVDTKAQRADVETLVEAAGDFDADAEFRLPGAAVEPESTLRDQAELAAVRLEEGCAPAEAERLREAIGD